MNCEEQYLDIDDDEYSPLGDAILKQVLGLSSVDLFDEDESGQAGKSAYGKKMKQKK